MAQLDTVQQGVANREGKYSDVNEDVRTWLSWIPVAEGEPSTKGEQETVQKIQEGERVCVSLCKEQCGSGAQAVDGHSPNSIILLVAKIKTGRLDCECYIQDFIFLLSL